MMTTKLSQTDRIRGLLERGPVCGTTMLRMMIPRYAARIHELRAAGLNIQTRTCKDQHHSHESNQIEYYIEKPPPAESGRLF